jgi:hypothetical protein
MLVVALGMEMEIEWAFPSLCFDNYEPLVSVVIVPAPKCVLEGRRTLAISWCRSLKVSWPGGSDPEVKAASQEKGG